VLSVCELEELRVRAVADVCVDLALCVSFSAALENLRRFMVLLLVMFVGKGRG
jgi:hypothetical protein